MTGPRRIRDIADLTDIVHELTSPRQHRQSYRAGWRHPNRTGAIIRDHITTQDSLLTQLRDAIVDRAGTVTGTGRMAYTTLPRFSADAYDRLEAIRAGVADWCDTAGIGSEADFRARLVARYLDAINRIATESGVITYPIGAALDILRSTVAHIRAAVELDMRALVHHAHGFDATTVDSLTADADRWRTWCRMMAGWDTPALRPHVPCPQCGGVAGERAGLRIRIDGASGGGGIADDAAVKAAVCLSCNRTWDAATIPLLAEQLRQTGHVLDGVA